jgi:lipopolysaccharide/colanic/teichoic acid biosynthesis glycosyltransferase
MGGNISGSWVTAFTATRLAEIAGVAWEGALPMPLGRANRNSEGRTYQSTTASARSIRVITDDDAEDHGILPNPIAPRHTQQVLSEDLFRSALIRERKRADRFDQVFGLVTIELAKGQNSEASPLLQSVAAAISAATRETDLVGWLESDALIAVMLPEIVAPAADVAPAIEARIVRDLTARFGSATMAKLTVRLHVHSGLGVNGTQAPSGDDPLVAEIQSARQRATAREALKRILDVVASLAMLALLSPLFLLLAALVKLTSSGPVLFKQKRIGEMAKPFTMLKFRSMQAKAAPGIHQQFVTDFIKSGGQGKSDSFFKIKSDPRITPIGHFLRKTSLDELPQLWNVLRGEMSLVGPRPPLQYELDQYRSWHWRRVLEAKPGMTGLWQVEGRSRTTFDEMVRLDLRYVRSRSLWTDIRILLATPRAVVTGKGAC